MTTIYHKGHEGKNQRKKNFEAFVVIELAVKDDGSFAGELKEFAATQADEHNRNIQLLCDPSCPLW